MKKFNLELLKITSDEVLERNQMKKITGGYPSYSAGNYMCRCEGSVGEWSAWYSSQSAANGSINESCSSGAGYCVRYYYA